MKVTSTLLMQHLNGKGNDWGAGDFRDARFRAKLSNGVMNLKLKRCRCVCLLKASTKDMTWSATKINTFGIIGVQRRKLGCFYTNDIKQAALQHHC